MDQFFNPASGQAVWVGQDGFTFQNRHVLSEPGWVAVSDDFVPPQLVVPVDPARRAALDKLAALGITEDDLVALGLG